MQCKMAVVEGLVEVYVSMFFNGVCIGGTTAYAHSVCVALNCSLL